MATCDVCGKSIVGKGISRGGKTFCCPDCLKHYQDKKKPSTKPNICEFC